MKVAVIVPAAGLGTRMGRSSAEKAGTSRKQFMLLEGSPIMLHTVRKFAASGRVHEMVVAVRSEDLEWVADLLAREFRPGLVRVVEGGNSRQQSVENALATLAPDTGLVQFRQRQPRGDLGARQRAGRGAHHQVRGGQVHAARRQPGDQPHFPRRARDAAAAQYQCRARHAPVPTAARRGCR